MALTKIKVNNLGDLDRVQDNIATALHELASKPLKDAVLVPDIALTTTNREIAHGLGRPVRGWIVVKQAAAVAVYSDTAHTNPSTFINLKSSAAATVSLLFI